MCGVKNCDKTATSFCMIAQSPLGDLHIKLCREHYEKMMNYANEFGWIGASKAKPTDSPLWINPSAHFWAA